MRINIEIDEAALRELVTRHLKEKLGSVGFDPKKIIIEVKSKQNYKSEWEAAAFRARLDINE